MVLINVKNKSIKKGIVRLLAIFSFIPLLFICSAYNGNVGPENKQMVVVIDAGHGGKDPGAIGQDDYYEKDVVLEVALDLGKKITDNFPDVKIIYTRDKDNFVELAERAAIANRNHASLFISIHANSAENHSAFGAETYVLGLHKSDATRKLMETENSVILLEDDQEKYSDFDGSPESLIILQYMQNVHLNKSTIFAQNIQRNFELQKRNNRGEKQAGFVVLYRTTMPSVLVEVGYISNNKEEKYLKSESGQNEIADAVFNAFKVYKKDFDMANGKISTPLITANDTNNDDNSHNNSNEKVVFKVQIITSNLKIALKPENFKGLTNVDEYISNGFYKYTVGEVDNYTEAKGKLQSVKELGFVGAFIVAFEGDNRINDLQKAIAKAKGN